VSKIYLTTDSFRNRAREFVELSVEPGRAILTPGKTALIAIDMQRYFVDPDSHAHVSGVEMIVEKIRALAEAFAVADLPVFFTRHGNTSKDAGALGRWWGDLIQTGSLGSEITPDLDTSLGTVVAKTQYDALYGNKLEEMLRERGVERVVITGVVTHLCCETTARAAYVRGFDVTFPVDATVSYSEEFHLATLLNLSHGFATIAFVEDVLDALVSSE